MVEKLTDTNLELEEKIEALNETVADLEALRDLSEEQEELRMEVEHDLREELDMNLNSVRQVGVAGWVGLSKDSQAFKSQFLSSDGTEA